MDETQSRAQERLEELGAGLTQTKRGNIYTLTIIGQIEGHQAQPETIKTTKYEHVLPLLATIEESEDIDGLLLLLRLQRCGQHVAAADVHDLPRLQKAELL